MADRRLTRAGQDPQRVLAEELAFYDEIRGQQGDDPQVIYERGMAARRAGDVHRLLDEPREAEDAYHEAIGLLAGLAELDPHAADYRRDLAAAHNGLAQLWQTAGRLGEAERELRMGAQLFETLAADDPKDVDYRRQLGVLWNNLAVQLNQQNRIADAEAAHQQRA